MNAIFAHNDKQSTVAATFRYFSFISLLVQLTIIEKEFEFAAFPKTKTYQYHLYHVKFSGHR